MSKNMTEAFKELSAIIRAFGFKGSGQNFYRIDQNIVAVINLQKSTGSNRFYINVGAKPIVLLPEGDSPKKVKEYDCMFRDRIAPPEGALGWGYGLTDLDLAEFKSKLENVNSNYFAVLHTLPETVKSKGIHDLLPENGDVTIYGAYHAATCYEFALLAKAYGLTEKSKIFAEAGIKICKPKATGLLAKLTKQINS